ncbi:MAG: hypothetical protein ABSA16_14940 [Thermoguttaceae bacterium]|jgi:hypothetical protein
MSITTISAVPKYRRHKGTDQAFKPTNGGYWGLFRESATNTVAESTDDVAANPLPVK